MLMCVIAIHMGQEGREERHFMTKTHGNGTWYMLTMCWRKKHLLRTWYMLDVFVREHLPV